MTEPSAGLVMSTVRALDATRWPSSQWATASGFEGAVGVEAVDMGPILLAMFRGWYRDCLYRSAWLLEEISLTASVVVTEYVRMLFSKDGQR